MNEDETSVASPAVEPGEDVEVQAASRSEPSGAEGAEATNGLWPVDRLRPLIEALLFAAGDPLPARKMVDFVEGSNLEEVKATLTELATEYLTRGVRLIEVAGGWQMRTAPEHQKYVRKLFRERPQRLTRAATETIAIVAYKQPVTRQEIETVRGVDSGGVLESLVERRLAKVVGRKDVPGRPLVYATTQEFLELFGLRNIRELPTLPELGSEFERMSEQGGFSEGVKAEILPLESEEHGAQDKTAEGSDEGDASQHERLADDDESESPDGVDEESSGEADLDEDGLDEDGLDEDGENDQDGIEERSGEDDLDADQAPGEDHVRKNSTDDD